MKHFDTLGVMLDCSRNAVPTLEDLYQFVDSLAAMGYNALQLYTEDVYEIEGEPYFGYQRGRYTKDELKAIDFSGVNRLGITSGASTPESFFQSALELFNCP